MKSKKTNKRQKAAAGNEQQKSPQKLTDVIILSLSVVFLIIGIDQVMSRGLEGGYWAIMLALVMIFIYTLRKLKR